MMAEGVNAATLREWERILQNDPGFQRVLAAAYPSEAMRSTAINDYVTNRSPIAAQYKAFLQSQQQHGGRGRKSYRYDAASGRFVEQDLGVQHWWSDPAVIGPLAVGTAAGVGGFLYGPNPAGAAGGAGAGAINEVAPNIATPAGIAGVNSLPVPPGGVPTGLTPPPGGFLPVGAGGRPGSGGNGGAPGADGAGGLGWDDLKEFFTDPSNLAGLTGLVAGLVGNRSGDNGQNTEELRRIQAITEGRMKRVDPLHQAVTQLAWGRLPISSRQGITPPELKPL